MTFTFLYNLTNPKNSQITHQVDIGDHYAQYTVLYLIIKSISPICHRSGHLQNIAMYLLQIYSSFMFGRICLHYSTTCNYSKTYKKLKQFTLLYCQSR